MQKKNNNNIFENTNYYMLYAPQHRLFAFDDEGNYFIINLF
jgi:hypothetical protein